MIELLNQHQLIIIIHTYFDISELHAGLDMPPIQHTSFLQNVKV